MHLNQTTSYNACVCKCETQSWFLLYVYVKVFMIYYNTKFLIKIGTLCRHTQRIMVLSYQYFIDKSKVFMEKKNFFLQKISHKFF